jgi:ATP-dependent Clp protease ATP-binding subunit ClpC
VSRPGRLRTWVKINRSLVRVAARRTAAAPSCRCNALIVFDRFTERARHVVVLAQQEARALRFSHIGTEALLFGLLREDEGLAARVLESFGVTLERARTEVARRVRSGQGIPESALIPFTPRAKFVLERAS